MKKILKYSTIATIIFLMVSPSWGGQEVDILAKLKKAYSKIHSVKADFTQVTTLGLKKKSTHKGRVYLVPGKSRWDYQGPNPQLVLTLGDKFLLYDPVNKEAVEGVLDKEAIVTRGPFFSLVDQIRKYYHVTQVQRDSSIVLTLVPKKPGSPVQKVTVYIDPKTLLIKKIETLDSLDNLNTVTFENIQVNVPIDPSLFQVKLPPGVKVSHP